MSESDTDREDECECECEERGASRVFITVALGITLCLIAFFGALTVMVLRVSDEHRHTAQVCLEQGGIWRNGECLFSRGGAR